MIVYSIHKHMSYLGFEDICILMRYSSLEEAKKYMVALYNKKLSDPKCEIISFDNSKYILCCSDKLFKYDNTCTYEIIEEEVEIKDKFDPMDL